MIIIVPSRFPKNHSKCNCVPEFSSTTSTWCLKYLRVCSVVVISCSCEIRNSLKYTFVEYFAQLYCPYTFGQSFLRNCNAWTNGF